MTETMLYKVSEKPNAELGGRKLVYRATAADAVEEALAAGWSTSPDEAEFGEAAPVAEASLLDGSIEEIKSALPALTDEDLLATLDAETAGKTRKGVISAIEAEVAHRQKD